MTSSSVRFDARILPRALMLLTCVLTLMNPLAHAERAVLSGTVTRVVDGDTIEVQLTSGPIRVRLNGIDTPERGQPGGSAASAALSALVMSKRVELEPFEQDRYERLIANIYVGDLDVNAEMVRRGHAWAYRQYLTRENVQLCALEADARAARRGLWALPASDRYAPWDWRKRPKQFVDYSQATAAECIAAMSSAR